MTVYVIQERSKLDLSAALEFGELEILLPERRDLMNNPRAVLKILESKLATFNDNDYLLAIGDPASISFASVVAVRNNNGRMKLLRWDNVEHKYLSLTLETR